MRRFYTPPLLAPSHKRTEPVLRGVQPLVTCHTHLRLFLVVLQHPCPRVSPKPPAADIRDCRFPPTLPSGHFPCLQDVGVALFTESHHHPGQVRGPVRPRSELFGESEMSPSWASFFNTLSQAQRSAGRVKHSTTFSSSRRIVSSHYFPLHVMYEIPNSPCARRGRIRRKTTHRGSQRFLTGTARQTESIQFFNPL